MDPLNYLLTQDSEGSDGPADDNTGGDLVL